MLELDPTITSCANPILSANLVIYCDAEADLVKMFQESFYSVILRRREKFSRITPCGLIPDLITTRFHYEWLQAAEVAAVGLSVVSSDRDINQFF